MVPSSRPVAPIVVRVDGGIATGGSGDDARVTSPVSGDELRGGSGDDHLVADANNQTLNGRSGVDPCDDAGHTVIVFISCETIV